MKLYVSVFSDSRAPVSKRRIQRLFKLANERLRVLNLELKLLNYEPKVDCKKPQIDYIRKRIINRRLPKPPNESAIHLRIFVTDKMYRWFDKSEAKTVQDVKFGQFLGYFGGDVFALYGLRSNMKERDLGGHCKVVTALLHELGHFFELHHTNHPDFLMNSELDHTKGYWHQEEQKIIQETIRKIQKKLPTTR